jgi:hypothetical protein
VNGTEGQAGSQKGGNPPGGTESQRLVDVVFGVAVHLHMYRNHFVGKSVDEIADWVAKQLDFSGFPTIPMGSSWGTLVSAETRKEFLESSQVKVSASTLSTQEIKRQLGMSSHGEGVASHASTAGRGLLVVPEWFGSIPLQQQSVLLLAARGPDGVRKHHPCKEVIRAYRGTVLRAAKYGRFLRWGEKADTFMGLDAIANEDRWKFAMRDYFDSVDELPHHYHLHLVHGAQVLAHQHPEEPQRQRWMSFYAKACEDAHLNPETEEQMNVRLSDWNQEHWDENQAAVRGRMMD